MFSFAHRAEHDVYRKLASILPQAVELQSASHGTNTGLGEVGFPALGMTRPKSLGDEDFYEIADQLDLGVTEDPLGCRIYREDSTVIGRHHNRIGGGQEESLEQRLRKIGNILLQKSRHRGHFF